MKHETIQRLTAISFARFIRVATFVLDKANSSQGVTWLSESSKDIVHNSRADRQWLASHCWWAMRNNRKVTTYPITAVYSPE